MFFQLLFPSDQILRSQLQLQQALRMICVVRGRTSEERNKQERGRGNGTLLDLYPHPPVPRDQRRSRHLESKICYTSG